MTEPADRDDDRIDEQLLQVEDHPQAAHDTTIVNLHKDLETLANDLAAPAPADPHEGESACQRAVQNVQTLAGAETVLRAGMETAFASPLESETLLGQYRILGKLGQGGMGAVYKALHTRLDKIVALKVLPEDRLEKSEAVARFLREMKAVGKIEHPHLVRALDAGEADGSYYLVMEHVDGIDLSKLLKEQGKLPVATACELVRQAALGLQAAHQRGMVHRDIKPANLMLARQDFGPPVVKVLDLGLARLVNDPAANETELTTNNQIMGTIDYMAPEQADNIKDVDTRADIYSLGATLLTLLTGQPPYHAAGQQTFMQKLNTLANAPIPNVRTLRSDVPHGLVTVLEKMLAKDRTKRYQEPTEAAKALEPFAANANLAVLLDDAKTQASLVAAPQSTATWAAPSTSPTLLMPKPLRNRPALLAGIALLILAPFLLLFAGTIIRFATNQGELVIEVDDPNIEIQIVQNGVVVKDKSKDREFTLTAMDGEIQVLDSDGLAVFTKEFQLTRGGKTILNVSQRDLAEARKFPPPKEIKAPDRYAAEWLIRSGNKFSYRADDGREHLVERADQIPSFDFRIRTVQLIAEKPPTDEEFASLKNLENLVSLTIGTNLSRTSLEQLPLLPNLYWLAFSGANFRDQDLEVLPRLPRLTELGLSSPTFTSQAGTHLEQLKNLRSLDLNGCKKVDDGIMKHVAKIKTLERLSLHGTSVADAGLPLLRALPNVQTLHLDHTAITSQGGPFLEQLQNLRVLTLGGTQVDDGILGNVAKLEQLEHLTPSALVTDEGLPLLARLKGLKLISLNYTKVTDAGVIAMPEWPQLQSLWLDHLPLTDAVVPVLAKRKQLTYLNVQDTKITADGIARLQNSLPNCRIEWDGGVIEPKAADSAPN